MGTTTATEYDVLVLGGGPVGLELASELSASGRRVGLLDQATAVERARRRGLSAHESTLESATSPLAYSAETVVVATPSDARNLLLAAAASRAFGAERVVALVNDPERRDVFDEAGVETVCVPTTVATETANSIGLHRETADATESASEVRLRNR